MKCCSLASVEAEAWATIEKADEAIRDMDLGYKNNYPDFLWEVFRPYRRMLSTQNAVKTAPYCNNLEQLRDKVRYSEGKECEVWRARLIELENEEAEREASVCESANDARIKLLYSTVGTKAEEIWTECYLRLSKSHAPKVDDVKEVVHLYEYGIGEGKEMYMVRYLELCIQRLVQK